VVGWCWVGRRMKDSRVGWRSFDGVAGRDIRRRALLEYNMLL
jgi:hypothetical protein